MAQFPCNTPCTVKSVQVLRSSGDWSAGIDTKDDSILQAMLHSINCSEHFIYFEVYILTDRNSFIVLMYGQQYGNYFIPVMQVQFFISNLPEQGVFNTVAEAVRKRIARAHAKNETFRVYLVITLLPEVGGKNQ